MFIFTKNFKEKNLLHKFPTSVPKGMKTPIKTADEFITCNETAKYKDYIITDEGILMHTSQNGVNTYEMILTKEEAYNRWFKESN